MWDCNKYIETYCSHIHVIWEGDIYVWLLIHIYLYWYMCICMFVCVICTLVFIFYTVSQFLFSFYTLEFILQNCHFFLWYSLCILIKITALKYIYGPCFPMKYVVFPWYVYCFHLHTLCCITFVSCIYAGFLFL